MRNLIRRKLRLFLLSVFLIAFSVACVLTQSDSTPSPPPPAEGTPQIDFEETQLGTVDRDVVYCTAEDGTELLMDVYYPEVNTGPWPVMMEVHGGGWSSGSKDEQTLFPDLTSLGLIGVSINYRLSPDVVFPAHIEDVKCAVRYLRANAEHYNLDPDRILALGGSAGGHLVSLLATTSDSGEFNVGQYLDQSSAVQAVIAMSAPTDLVNWGCGDIENVETYYQYAFGSDAQCGESDPLLVNASPIHYVSNQDVPILLLAGTADDVVPYQQSERLHEALLDAGVDSQLLLVEDGGHDLNVPGHPERGEEVLWAMLDFILVHLELDAPEWLNE